LWWLGVRVGSQCSDGGNSDAFPVREPSLFQQLHSRIEGAVGAATKVSLGVLGLATKAGVDGSFILSSQSLTEHTSQQLLRGRLDLAI